MARGRPRSCRAPYLHTTFQVNVKAAGEKKGHLREGENEAGHHHRHRTVLDLGGQSAAGHFSAAC